MGDREKATEVVGREATLAFGNIRRDGNGTAPQVSDTGLFDEKVRTDIIARAKGDKQIVIGGFMGSTTGNGFTYQEAALVTGPLASQWRLFARVAINPIVKSTSVIISVSWQVDLA